MGAEVVDRPRVAALGVLEAVRGGGYAQLELARQLRALGLSGRDAGFATELANGTCRTSGSLDRIIEAAAGRPLGSLQPAVVDLLRLGSYQWLRMRVPAHAAVASTVDLARARIGRHAVGVVNAILRRVTVHSWSDWLDQLSVDGDPVDRLALTTCHPRWIVEALAPVTPPDELAVALAANNVAPVPTLAVRPGLLGRADLLASGGQPTPYSPWGVIRPGDPGDVPAVRHGLAAVQDEGSQLVTGLLADAPAGAVGPWLDACAGPGGKAALLAGLAQADGAMVLAAELHPHRAKLVQQSLRAYDRADLVVVADATRPAWRRGFARVLVDAPCSGLGALRRRPEARWRKTAADLPALTDLQTRLLARALDAALPGAVVAYVTCSPLAAETVAVVQAVMADHPVEVLDAPALLTAVPQTRALTDPRFVQLWPHRHGTDAMFAALLRVEPQPANRKR